MRKRFIFLELMLATLGLIACGPATALPAAPQPVSTPPIAAVVETGAPGQLFPSSAIRFESLSTDDGLSQSVVNAIVQDRQGFLWLGTQDGLNRYDGNQFKVFKPNLQDPTSLSDGWVTVLYVDRDGFLWVGTNQGGLNRYDSQTGKFTRFQHNPNDLASLAGGPVNAIYQDRDGNLWVGTRDGLNRLDPGTGTFAHYQNDLKDPSSLSQNTVNVIDQDARGNLWIGTDGGLNLFDAQTGVFRRFLPNVDDPASLSYGVINALLGDAQGNLWVGTDKGLNYFDVHSEKFTRYLHDDGDSNSLGYDNVHNLLIDQRGTLWVGTAYGLDRFDAVSGKFVHYRHNPLVIGSLSQSDVISLYEDRSGIIWIGTWGGGVSQYNRRQDKFAMYRFDPDQPKSQSLSEAGIFSLLAEKSGSVWVGTAGSGLDRFDAATGQVTAVFNHNPNFSGSLSSNEVWAIKRDSQGILWIGTSNGLDQFKDQTGTFAHHVMDDSNPASISGNLVSVIYEDRGGELWIGTRRGLDRYVRASDSFIHYSQVSDADRKTPVAVVDILEDRASNVYWVATSGYGLYRFDRQAGTFQRYVHNPDDLNSLTNDIVLGIYQDSQGSLWLSTGGGGVSKFNPATGDFTTFSEAQGLANNFVYCLIPDDQGFYWFSTNFGVSKFDPRTATFHNYTLSDGLQSNEFNQGACSRSPDGSIYFGGGYGFNRFFPQDIRATPYQPPVALTSLTTDGKPFDAGRSVETVDEITLTWPQNSFEFEFAALSFDNPRHNQYAYMLENFDKTWNFFGSKHDGRYTNLPGGQYTLRLKASNSEGVWNETGKAIKVTVIPPFWQTWWFYSLVGVAFIGAVAGGYRYRVSSIESRRLELERQVTERTREIERLFEQTKELAVIEERNRLARELHDSAKQKAFAALAQLGTANGLIQHDVKAARSHISEAENLVYDVIQELTFLIQEMYPLALKEKGLVTSLREYVFEWENRTGIRVNLQAENERRLPLNVEQALYRIAQESLANVARHSHANRAEIKVNYGADNITLNVQDDGQGFDVATRPKGVGLRSIQERAESFGGQVSIWSTLGNGACVNVTIPNHYENPGV